MSNCCVYKYVYNNEVVYVGKSDHSLKNRLNSHKKEDKFKPYLSKSDIYYAWVKNPAMTIILETYLINKYKPKLNVSMKYDYEIPFEIPEPCWHLLSSQGIKYRKGQEELYPIQESRKKLEWRVKELERQLDLESEQRKFYSDMFSKSLDSRNDLLNLLNNAYLEIRTKNKHISELENTVKKSIGYKVTTFLNRLIKE